MIKDNILRINEKIQEICAKIKQDPKNIKIVAVSKGRTEEQIKEVIDAGIFDIGENRIQEAKIKYQGIRNTEYGIRIKWHMVGHLQTNKVKEAVKIFDLIQSVDSFYLAQEINKTAEKINKIQEILIEVKTSPEVTKFGIEPDKLLELIINLKEFKNIKIKGLMTIAPLVDDSEKTRPYFRKLKQLQDKINTSGLLKEKMQILSMGMTNDFSVAIEEGSNMLRLGRAIFED